MKKNWWRSTLALLALFCGTALAANTAVPGTLNYVEGQAQIGAEALTPKSVGQAELQPGQTLDTRTGKAEVLLTPGVFLRLDDNSAAQMISPSLTNTEVALNKGRAMVEVDEIHKGNDLQVKEDGVTTRLLKTGLYEFSADNGGQMAVYKGEAQVLDNDRQVKVKSGHELDFNNPKLKTTKFDKKAFQNDELYRWSDVRSSYLAEANADRARYIVNNWYGGPGWSGAGWYWDPFFASYTFIPGDGMFYSPFGWGYYSPYLAYYAPYYGYGYGYGYPVGRDGDGDRDDVRVVAPRGTTVVPRPATPRVGAAPRMTAPRMSAPARSAPRMAAPRMTAPRMGVFHSGPAMSGGFHAGPRR